MFGYSAKSCQKGFYLNVFSSHSECQALITPLECFVPHCEGEPLEDVVESIHGLFKTVRNKYET